jgi:6,7-dimethyl-8-ribityllumazine synthase
MPEFTGTPDGTGRRFVVVASRFNESVTTRLLEGAIDALLKHGVPLDDIDSLSCPPPCDARWRPSATTPSSPLAR